MLLIKKILRKLSFMKNFRYMRVIVFFDLPVLADNEKRDYRQFRKMLIKNGFIMQQKSVYSKLALNNTVAEAIKDTIRRNKPKSGLIEMLVITELQYNKIEYILGENEDYVEDSTNRLIVL